MSEKAKVELVKRAYMGRSVKRKHDVKFLTGRARYVDDISYPGMLHCVFLGSIYAHARIKKIDYSEALKLKGVVMVLTGEDCVKHLDPLPPTIDLSNPPFNWHWRTVKAYPLAVDKVRFVGEPVAAVIAEDPYIAEDALELIKVEYEPLPAVNSIEKALKGDVLLYEEWGDNIQAKATLKDGDIDAAFKEADRVVKFRYKEARHSAFPIEPRGCVSIYDPKTGTLTHYDNTQAPFLARRYMAKVLRMPENKIRIISADVGGAFGNRLHWYKEVIPALASKLTGRPVKWFESKKENFQTQTHAGDFVWEAEIAVKNDGTILGYRAKITMDIGVDGTNRGVGAGYVVEAALISAGPFKVKAAEVEIMNVVTNKSFTCAERGLGKPVATSFLGNAMFNISKELGIPILDLLERNLIKPEEHPYRQLFGEVIEHTDFNLLLSKAREVYRELEAKKAEIERAGKKAGIGVVAWMEPSGSAIPYSKYYGIEVARVAICPTGGVKVYTNITDIGQGTESTLAQMVADILGVDMDEVEVVEGDSDITGGGPWSARGAVYGASAVAKAAKILRERLLKVGAELLKEEEVDLLDGHVVSKKDSSKRISIYDIVNTVYFWPGAHFVLDKEMVERGEFIFDVQVSWFSPLTAENPTSINAAHGVGIDLALVEVDPKTGIIKVLDYYTVHDTGRMINPAVVEAQLHGGIVHGMARALYEELVYDENGQLLNPNYVDYLMPTALEIPKINVIHYEIPSKFTELGTKGIGEGGVTSSPATVSFAVKDALGVAIEEAPIKPEKVLEILKAK